jgi:hypothetical protein
MGEVIRMPCIVNECPAFNKRGHKRTYLHDIWITDGWPFGKNRVITCRGCSCRLTEEIKELKI